MAEQANQKNGQQPEQDLNQLLKVRREKLAELQANGKDPFVITKYDQTAHSADIRENYAELEGKEVSIAGRMMSKRVMGKASFCNVQDKEGGIQCYVARDNVGEEFYKDFTSGVDYDEIIDEAVEFAYKHLEERPQYEIESLTNYENMKDKLVMEIQAKSTFIFSAYYKTK